MVFHWMQLLQYVQRNRHWQVLQLLQQHCVWVNLLRLQIRQPIFHLFLELDNSWCNTKYINSSKSNIYIQFTWNFYYSIYSSNYNGSNTVAFTDYITVTAIPVVNSATTPASRCDAGTVALQATASLGTLNWYMHPLEKSGRIRN